MNRKRIAVLLIALICAGGLAIAAATVSTPTGGNPGEGVGTGSGSSDQPNPPEEESEQQSINIPDWLQSLAIALSMLSILVASYLAIRRMNAGSTVKMLAIGAVTFLLLLAVMAAMADAPSFEQAGGEPEPEPDNGSGAAGGEGGPGRQPAENPTQSTDLPAALFGVFGLVVLLLVVTIYRFSGSDSDVDLPEAVDDDEDGSAGAMQAVGEAAGRAADDLQADDADVENAVYQAWRGMTDALDVDAPRTTTPEEFADVAIDVGMAPDDVRELTWLFEEIRYGNATVTADRERRAQQALRRVQETYADQEDSDE